jgi:hypothetical protein
MRIFEACVTKLTDLIDRHYLAGWNPVMVVWQGQKTLPTSSIGPYYMGVYDTAHYYYRGTSRLQELEELGYNSEGETRCTKTKVIYR